MENNSVIQSQPGEVISINGILTSADQLLQIPKEEESNKNLFTVRTANGWLEQAKTRPIPQMLFSEFWHEGELCILFADTNLGKSILAMQIANSISKGEEIFGFRLETLKQYVLCCDFELSEKQFENRYSKNFTNHYDFDDNLMRIEINPETDIPNNVCFEDYLNSSLEDILIQTNAKILIIDNLTYLRSETEKAKDALPLMKHLKALKKKYGLSILALAHTPKRDITKPLTQNDLQGSKMLMNFCDSAFAIGQSHLDRNIRCLKQIKCRNTERIYDSENVCVCQISKPGNFLGFEFMDFGNEKNHLKQHTDTEKEALAIQVIELRDQGKSVRDIGNSLRISHMTAKRIIEGRNRP